MSRLLLHDATRPKLCLLLFVQQTSTVTTRKVSDDSLGLWQLPWVAPNSYDWLQDAQCWTIGVKVPYSADESVMDILLVKERDSTGSAADMG